MARARCLGGTAGTNFIQTALAPARDRFDAATYRKLCAAVALVIGTESMIVFRDVLQIEEAEARKVESWMVSVLTQAALRESRVKSGKDLGLSPQRGGKKDEWAGCADDGLGRLALHCVGTTPSSPSVSTSLLQGVIVDADRHPRCDWPRWTKSLALANWRE